MVTAQTKPKVIRQTFLKPGRYSVNGRVGDLTREGLGELVTNTRKLLANGWRPPVIRKHAAPGSKEGGPVSSLVTDPADTANHVGRLIGIGQNADGSAYHELEITDDAAAKQIANKTVKFTSPEIRPSFVDGKGNQYGPLVAHVALTGMPRNPDQGDLVEISQFSLTSEVSQFALSDLMGDDDAEGGDRSNGGEGKEPDDSEKQGEAAPDEPENPDAPTDSSEEMEFQALVQMQAEEGYVLPANVDKKSYFKLMLTAVKTARAIREKQKADEAEEAAANQSPDSPAQLTEEQPPAAAQYSLDDVEGNRVPNKLASRIIRQEHDGLVSRIERLRANTSITPALSSSLKAQASISQFAIGDDIAELPCLTLSDFVGMLESGMPPGKLLGNPTKQEAAQFSADTDTPIPEAPESTIDESGRVDREAAKRIYEETRHLIPKELRRE